MDSIAMPAIEARRAKRREPRFDPTIIRLSETGDCARKQLLRVLGYPQTHPQPPEALDLMSTGDVWESLLVQDLVDHYGAEHVSTQVVVTTPQGSEGHIDAVVSAPGVPRRFVEAKATKVGSRKYLPNARNVRQVQAYLHYEGRRRGIDTAELLYVLRETGEIIPVVGLYDAAMGADIEREQTMLNRLKAEQCVPDIVAGTDRKKFPCYYKTTDYEVYCPFWGHCWAQQRKFAV